MGDNRRPQQLVPPPTIPDIQKAWCGVRALELAGKLDEAQAINKVISAFMQVRDLSGAKEYPDNQQ